MPVYNFACDNCKAVVEKYTPSWKDEVKCDTCSAPMEKQWSLGHSQNGYQGFPFTTTNITGQPLEIRSPGHLREVERQYGVVMRDDVSFLTKTYEGIDFRTGRQRYRESGRGMPGQWI